MSGPTYILAQLGDPWGYESVRYMLEEGPTVESTTSVAALVRLARELGRDPFVFVMVQESLLAPPPRGRRGYELLTPDNARRYGELVRGMLGAVRSLLRESIGDGARLVVGSGPSAGLYGVERLGYRARWVLAEGLGVDIYGHYYSIALLKILATILEDLLSQDWQPEELEIWIDTTHGQNYAGIAFLRAAIQASRILSALLNAPVLFRQYNSEPFIKGVTRELQIHKIREETVSPKRAASSLVYTLIQADPYKINNQWEHIITLPRNTPNYAEHRKKLSKTIREKAGWLYKGSPATPPKLALQAATGLFFGAPLLLLQAGRWALEASQECRGPTRCLQDIIKEILSYTDPIATQSPSQALTITVHKSNTTQITYKVAPVRPRLTSLLAGAALAGYVASAYAKICRNSCEPPPRGQAVHNSICASPQTLEAATRHYIAGPVWRLVEQELSLIKDSTKQKPVRKEPLYQLVHRAVRCDTCLQPPGRPSKDARIFQAHAGLPNGMVGACARNGEACLYYVEVAERILSDISVALLGELRIALILNNKI